MCYICANISGQLRQGGFLPGEIGSGFRQNGQRESDAPQFFLNGDDRGDGVLQPNGKTSFSTEEAGAHITRTNHTWAAGLGLPVTVTFAFRATMPGSIPSSTATDYSRFTEAQIIVALASFQAWSDVANITFSRVGTGTSGEGAYADNATILLANYANGQSGAAAFAFLPGGTGAGDAAGDVWVNISQTNNSTLTLLGYGTQTMTHEIGHAIGLRHPGAYNASEGGGPITYAGQAEYYEDSRQYTVMSYFDETNTGAQFGARWAAAPLLDDISAAQRLYGANLTTRTGDTTYGFNSNTDRGWYSASASTDKLIFAVWDAGGNDTFDFSGYSEDGTIDLRQTAFSSVGGLVGNVSIALGAAIENAIGGSGAETIWGNSGNNSLRGNGGNDTIDGGLGTDTAVFSGNRDQYTITVNGQTVTVTGPDGTDTLTNVEFLQFADTLIAAGTTGGLNVAGDTLNNVITGTAFGDTLRGLGGNDTLNGGDGDDILDGGRGTDTLSGGAGVDTASYSTARAGVTVDLSVTVAQNTGASTGSDTLSSIENLIGSAFSDTLTGDAGANEINGNGGIDVLNGGGGNDVLRAGAPASQAAADVVKAQGTVNNSIATAVNIDANFDLGNDAGVLNATTTPHAVIRGTGHGGPEYYAVTVAAGAECRFDIDGASFDAYLYIYDAAGNLLAANDDGGDSDGAATDSLLTYTFATGGTYYIMVNRWVDSSTNDTTPGPGVPAGGTYTLNVSVPGHSVVAPTLTGSTLNGGDGDDTLHGSAGADTFNGGAGTDTAVYAGNRAAYTITTVNGVTTITGPDGSDTLSGVERAQFADQLVVLGAPTGVTLNGTANGDVLNGTEGDDTLNGLDGNDTLIGLAGADQLNGGAGIDGVSYASSNAGVTVSLVTGAGAGGHAAGDVLSSIEILYGSAFADTFTGDGAANTFFGADGQDTLSGGDGNDVLVGNDQIFVQEADTLIGGNGDDTLYGENVDTLSGGAGFDVLIAVNAYDFTLNMAATSIELAQMDFGNDNINASGQTVGVQVYASGGNDGVIGSGFNDLIFGGVGNDVIVGGDGDDAIVGEAGVDQLDGGAGNDRIYFDAQDSFVFGAGGYDAGYILATGGSGVIIDMGASSLEFIQDLAGGDDTILASTMTQALYAAAGAGNDTVDGSAYGDVVFGDGGNDVLNGNGGDDRLIGGAGLDTLYGGLGNDALYGGAGDGVQDVFRFGEAGAAHADAVYDFVHGIDKIDLSAFGSNFAAVSILTAGSDAVVYLNGQVICTVVGAAGTLDASDFIFVSAAPGQDGKDAWIAGTPLISDEIEGPDVLPAWSGAKELPDILPAVLGKSEGPDVSPLAEDDGGLEICGGPTEKAEDLSGGGGHIGPFGDEGFGRIHDLGGFGGFQFDDFHGGGFDLRGGYANGWGLGGDMFGGRSHLQTSDWTIF
ncbi:M10 family metallopeptidase C-terminal domain-containing protein [Brevundimonas sp. 2R-24]|uniref:M10 family metallopeptidase C-terminal domain-containing protein n=1 Tax=Peiella sedimenti TaxID=3061083 RepID=A0ABT8SKB2_9CAUL|nr:M10 family metallopeptidase C-terminal domain-containing protein [Caulobacteraceae bacterium XZ-24]